MRNFLNNGLLCPCCDENLAKMPKKSASLTGKPQHLFIREVEVEEMDSSSMES
jgi:hypothetical protein